MTAFVSASAGSWSSRAFTSTRAPVRPRSSAATRPSRTSAGDGNSRGGGSAVHRTVSRSPPAAALRFAAGDLSISATRRYSARLRSVDSHSCRSSADAPFLTSGEATRASSVVRVSFAADLALDFCRLSAGDEEVDLRWVPPPRRSASLLALASSVSPQGLSLSNTGGEGTSPRSSGVGSEPVCPPSPPSCRFLLDPVCGSVRGSVLGSPSVTFTGAKNVGHGTDHGFQGASSPPPPSQLGRTRGSGVMRGTRRLGSSRCLLLGGGGAGVSRGFTVCLKPVSTLHATATHVGTTLLPTVLHRSICRATPSATCVPALHPVPGPSSPVHKTRRQYNCPCRPLPKIAKRLPKIKKRTHHPPGVARTPTDRAARGARFRPPRHRPGTSTPRVTP